MATELVSGQPSGGSFIEIAIGKPLPFEDTGEPLSVPVGELSAQRLLARSIKAYQVAARELLSGRYLAIAKRAAPHLLLPCNIYVICCPDGTVVRFDAAPEGQAETRVRVAVTQETLRTVAPKMTDNIVHFPSGQADYQPLACGPVLQLEKRNFSTGESALIDATIPMIFVETEFPQGSVLPLPPHRPPPLISISNELDLAVDAQEVPAEPGHATRVQRSTDIKVRQRLKLNVGWLAIEVYPILDPSYWLPEYAAMWAETDILACNHRQELEDAQLRQFDPHTEARQRMHRLLDELQALLDGREEAVHQFLKSHPELLSVTHTDCWSKLAFGDRESDFVFREPDGRYLLVELERADHLLFRKDGHPRQALNHAIGQIADWRTYLEQNLEQVRSLGLVGISTNPDALIVIGRSSQLSARNRAKLTTLQNQMPKLRMMTYDDLIAYTRGVVDNLFGSVQLETTGQVYVASHRRDERE